MSLQSKINSDLKDAMKGGDALRRDTLSMLRSQIHNKEIEKGKKDEGLGDEEIIEIVSSEVKRRREAAEGFRKGEREDLAEKELAEEKMLAEYLPPQLSEEEVMAEVEKIVAEAGTRDKKDFGMLMGKAMESLRGRTDGATVKKKLEELLQ